MKLGVLLDGPGPGLLWHPIQIDHRPVPAPWNLVGLGNTPDTTTGAATNLASTSWKAAPRGKRSPRVHLSLPFPSCRHILVSCIRSKKKALTIGGRPTLAPHRPSSRSRGECFLQSSHQLPPPVDRLASCGLAQKYQPAVQVQLVSATRVLSGLTGREYHGYTMG